MRFRIFEGWLIIALIINGVFAIRVVADFFYKLVEKKPWRGE